MNIKCDERIFGTFNQGIVRLNNASKELSVMANEAEITMFPLWNSYTSLSVNQRN